MLENEISFYSVQDSLKCYNDAFQKIGFGGEKDKPAWFFFAKVEMIACNYGFPKYRYVLEYIHDGKII